MLGQPRVDHLGDPLVAVEELGDRHGVVAMPVHPDPERLDPAQGEIGVEGAGNGPGGVLQEPEPLEESWVTGDKGPADDVAVAAEVLGRRVQHDVGAELERTLQIGRGERVVDAEDRPGLM